MANEFDLQIKWLNGSQIEVQAGEGAALTGNEKVLIMQNDTPKETTTQAIADLGGGGGSSYLVYTALLTQSGTDAPVATVLENTLGGTVVWSYGGAGLYTATLAGVFTANKTAVFISSSDVEGNPYSFAAKSQTEDTVSVTIVFTDGVPSNDVLNNTSIEIRVYP